MWLKLSNGRDELVINEDHIKRLKDEGAIEITDPRPQETPLEKIMPGHEHPSIFPEHDPLDEDHSSKGSKSKKLT
jgi:hypothetical protein